MCQWWAEPRPPVQHDAVMIFVSEQKMLRVRDEEMSRSGSRGRGLSAKGAGHLSEDDEEEDEDEEGFSESELELYQQYKAAGYRDLVSDQSDIRDSPTDQSYVRQQLSVP